MHQPEQSVGSRPQRGIAPRAAHPGAQPGAQRERLLLDILRLADRLGVELAFPTQTLHVAREPEEPPEPWPVPESDAEPSAAETGERAADEVTAEQPWRSRRPEPFSFPDSVPKVGSIGIQDAEADLDDG